jgi:membrane-associated phospholipid phosphatase
MRWEYVAFPVVSFSLAYGTAATKKLFVGLYPLGLIGILYDGMRLARNVGVTEERVHLCDLRAAEATVFGWHGATIHDWIQAGHTNAVLDAFFSIPYATFLFVCIGFAVYAWRRDFLTLRRFGWCFFVVNVAGFATYHLYPAAPPWYFHEHGCVVDLAANAEAGSNLARVDAWLGFPYFHGMYARATEVFGAIPSLHCAYPLMITILGWRWLGTFGRSLSIAFFVSMCVGAVYLDHHWILDVLAGIVYALGTVALVCVLVRPEPAR